MDYYYHYSHVFLIVISGLVVVRRPFSLVFCSLLVFLILGVITENLMDFYKERDGDYIMAWEVRYVYGYFDTFFLVWFPIRFGNFRNREKRSIIWAGILSSIWLFFLILHYAGLVPFNPGIMESSASIIFVLLFGFSILTRAELIELPLVSSLNFLLVGFLLYLFCTIVLFGIEGTAVRRQLYGFIHGTFHIIRDLFIAGAVYLEFKSPKTKAAQLHNGITKF